MQNFSRRAAAEYCGLSKSFLDKRRVAGDGPLFLKFGRAVRYRREDLDHWMAKQSHSSTTRSSSELEAGQ